MRAILIERGSPIHTFPAQPKRRSRVIVQCRCLAVMGRNHCQQSTSCHFHACDMRRGVRPVSLISDLSCALSLDFDALQMNVVIERRKIAKEAEQKGKGGLWGYISGA